jgi:hypothetical protein
MAFCKTIIVSWHCETSQIVDKHSLVIVEFKKATTTEQNSEDSALVRIV